MRGFLRRSPPLLARRDITMLPAVAVLALRLPTTDSLVISQVVLSFGIPFALVPMVWLTRRTDVMDALANHPITTPDRQRLHTPDHRNERRDDRGDASASSRSRRPPCR